jgi:predicted RNA-binding Zn ribbon-like protein
MEHLELIRDFVNTADLEAGEDRLADARGLQYWLVFHGLAELHDRASADDVATALDVRESLRELLRSNNGVEVDLAAHSAILDAAARRSGVGLRFEEAGIRFVADGTGIAGSLGGVLAAVGGAMTDGSWRRLKACRSHTCRWAFVDNARNLSRQWCDMAVCGNRAKARAFRSRGG